MCLEADNVSEIPHVKGILKAVGLESATKANADHVNQPYSSTYWGGERVEFYQFNNVTPA